MRKFGASGRLCHSAGIETGTFGIIDMPRKLILTMLAVVFATLSQASQAQADICHRQNLTGAWINPDAQPGHIRQVEIGYRCNVARSVRWSIRASYVRADGHEVWFSGRTAQVMEGADEDQPNRIGAAWGGTDANCQPPFHRDANEFWHVIVTWRTDGLHVMYRGRRCLGGRFQRRNMLQRP